jgi:hypothetical protein
VPRAAAAARRHRMSLALLVSKVRRCAQDLRREPIVLPCPVDGRLLLLNAVDRVRAGIAS